MLGGGITGWIESHPVIEGCLKNPLAVALILSGIVAVIAWAVAGVRGKQLMRVTLWVAFFSSAALYIHYLIVEKSIHEDATYSASRETVLSATQSAVGRGEDSLVQPRMPNPSARPPAFVPRSAPPSLAAGDYEILGQVLGDDWGNYEMPPLASTPRPAPAANTPRSAPPASTVSAARPLAPPPRPPLDLSPPSRLSFASVD